MAPATMPQRLLNMALPPEESVEASSLHWMRLLLLIHAAVRAWAWVHAVAQHDLLFYHLDEMLAAAALTLAAVLGLFPRTGRAACMMALVPALGLVAITMPSTENHVLLEAVVLGLFAWLDPRKDEDARLLVAGIRWVAAIVFFHTGLQKALGGLYFHGEFLTWIMKGSNYFAEVFRWMLPEREMARLATLDGYTEGSGPYRSHSWMLVVASNLVWITEMVLPVLMVALRTRVAATLASIAMVLLFQLAAREIVFASLFTLLLVTWLPGPWHRRLAPLWLLVDAAILAHISGLVSLPMLARMDGSI